MIKRSDLPAGGTFFRMNILPGVLFARFPIETPPPDGTLGFVNTTEWQSAAIWQDGQWLNASKRPMKRTPTHWTVIVEDENCNG